MSTGNVPSTSKSSKDGRNLSNDVDSLTLTDAARQQMAMDKWKTGGLEEEGQEDRIESDFPGLKNQRDLAHYSLFGRRGHIQPTKSTRLSWSPRNDFVKPLVVPWVIPLSSQDLLRLLNGFVPIKMEDKLFIYSDGPIVCLGESGNEVNAKATVHFHRSWTGEKIAALNVDISWGKEDASCQWTGKVTNITHEGEPTKCCPPKEDDSDDPEKLAKFYVLEGCKWVLGIYLHSDEHISEPKCWKNLTAMPVQSVPTAPTSYIGTQISQETLDDLMRIGHEATILLS